MSEQSKSEYCFLLKPANAADEIATEKSIENFIKNLKIEKPKLIIDFAVMLQGKTEETKSCWVL